MDYRLARQSTGWLYLFFIPFIHVVYRLLFRKIYLHNRQGIKPNTPVLIAANHPTAFIDPIFFCLFFDPPVYNMTRGDIFRKPFFRKLLMSCNMFPVFRQRDGYQGRDRNDEVFEFCQQKLERRVAVNIFVEGEHHLDKRVLPAQKGIARIAFGTYERHRMEDLQIVPVGCNYVDGLSTRDEAKIIVGEPIFIKDYWEVYEKKPGLAITKLCKDIEKALKTLCYHVENREDDALVDQLLSLWRNSNSATRLPVVEEQAQRFWSEKEVIRQVNVMTTEDKNILRDKTSEYFAALGKAGVADEALMHPEHANNEWLFWLIPAAPIALFGFALGWPVRWVVYRVTNKAIKKREFYTSVLMGMGVLAGGIYFALLMLLGFGFNLPGLVTVALLMPLLAWVSIFWKENMLRWRAARKAKAHPAREALQAQRKDLEKYVSINV